MKGQHANLGRAAVWLVLAVTAVQEVVRGNPGNFPGDWGGGLSLMEGGHHRAASFRSTEGRVPQQTTGNRNMPSFVRSYCVHTMGWPGLPPGEREHGAILSSFRWSARPCTRSGAPPAWTKRPGSLQRCTRRVRSGRGANLSRSRGKARRDARGAGRSNLAGTVAIEGKGMRLPKAAATASRRQMKVADGGGSALFGPLSPALASPHGRGVR